MSLRADPSARLSFGRQRGVDERDCPECGVRMRCTSLEHVAVEACWRHGVWLDAGEMQTVLRRSYQAHLAREKKREPGSAGILLRWLGGLLSILEDVAH